MHNVRKMQAPFERLKKFGLGPDVALRKAIIMQAISDATSIARDIKAIKAKYEAHLWLLDGGEDFNQICIEADLDPQFVRDVAREEIAMHRAIHRFTPSKSNHVYKNKEKGYGRSKCKKRGSS